MNGIKSTLAGIALSACWMGSALADPHHHHHHGGRVHFGISIGVPVYGPRYFPPSYYYPQRYYYYPPAYMVSPVDPVPVVPVAPVAVQPPVYVERPQAQAEEIQPQANSPYWYYCAASQAYYPYVKTCASGWQQVTPQPPQQ